MAARRPKRPPASQGVRNIQAKSMDTERAIEPIRRAVRTLQSISSMTVIEGVDLVVGQNAVEHGLGRAPRYVGVMPTVADASFGWGVNTDNPLADRQVLIDVVGVDQPGASVLVM